MTLNLSSKAYVVIGIVLILSLNLSSKLFPNREILVDCISFPLIMGLGYLIQRSRKAEGKPYSYLALVVIAAVLAGLYALKYFWN